MNTSLTKDVIKVETSVLIGEALDWAVMKCEGWIYEPTSARPAYYRQHVGLANFYKARALPFSSDWSHGGPIIDRKKISIIEYDGVWKARKENEGTPDSIGSGPTPLIAAMRCRVASKLGDAIEIPKELA